MKQRWRQLAERFARLSRRERTVLLIGGLAVIVLVGFSVVDGTLKKQRVLEKQIAQARTDAAASQVQVQALVRQLAQDPNERARAMIAQLTEEVRELDAQMHGINRGLVPPQEMAGILEEMLTRGSRVKLVSLKTLPVSYLIKREPDDKSANVYKHGIEMTLQGRYLDLLRYLDRLEALPWQMFWAQASMDASDYPAVRISVTVYTLSLDKNWLMV